MTKLNQIITPVGKSLAVLEKVMNLLFCLAPFFCFASTLKQHNKERK